MNPLDALSALNLGSLGGSIQLPVTVTTPPTPGAAIGEGFKLPDLDQLNQLGATQARAPTAALAPLGSGGGPSTWGHMVQQMVMDVNSKQQSAAAQVNDVLRGGPTPVHQAMISTEEASLSFEFLSEVRNKIVDAYQQIMQMQV